MEQIVLQSSTSGAKEPLTERSANVASAAQSSKIPAFGGATTSHLKLPSVVKRIAVSDNEQAPKRMKLDPSPEVTLNDQTEETAALSKPVKRSSGPSAVKQVKPAAKKPVNTRPAANSVKHVATKAPVKLITRNVQPSSVVSTNSKAANQSSVFVFKGSAAASCNSTVPAAGASKSSGAGAKKRAAWDTKGRLEDMEMAMSRHLEQNTSLQQQILQSNDRIAMLESLNCQLKGTVQQKEEMTTQANDEIMSLRRQLREKDEELSSQVSRLNRQLADVEFSRSTLERQKVTLEGELTAARDKIIGLESTIARLSSAQAGIEAELSVTKVNLDACRQSNLDKDNEIKACRAEIDRHLAAIDELNVKIRLGETLRRKQHNTILELKGNIRVFTRVRPLLGQETLGSTGEISHIHFPDDHCTLELEKLADVSPNESVAAYRKGSGNKYEFKFDQVFGPTATQREIFEEISQLVQSALDGYNVCIFAYGQTGSGKTYTMEGPNNPDETNQGMIPRAVAQIFQTACELEDKGWKYDFEVTYIEIYNENIRDLLGSGKEDVRHEIRLVASGSSEVYVTNLTTVKVTCESQVHDILKKASHNRSVAETKCNERSSRSHSVFRLRIAGTNSFTQESCCGLLNLIDLAGSERLKDSGSEGQRLKETQSINKSLANLGNVIMSLANKDSHVPYRNSKLTHLLQNCLGGSSKTLMFVNVSPKEECFQETLNSLRFATKVNECYIGTAQKRVK